MLVPLGKRILAQPIEEVRGTLILNNSSPTKFKVVSIGDEITKLKIGDTIYLSKFFGVELEHEGQKFIVLEENLILAKLD